jgi:hypothetical protein
VEPDATCVVVDKLRTENKWKDRRCTYYELARVGEHRGAHMSRLTWNVRTVSWKRGRCQYHVVRRPSSAEGSSIENRPTANSVRTYTARLPQQGGDAQRGWNGMGAPSEFLMMPKWIGLSLSLVG